MHSLIVSSEVASELRNSFFGLSPPEFLPYFPYPSDPLFWIFLSKMIVFSEFPLPTLLYNTCPYLGQSGKRKKEKYYSSPCFGLFFSCQIDILSLSHQCGVIWRYNLGRRLQGHEGGVLNGASVLKRHREINFSLPREKAMRRLPSRNQKEALTNHWICWNLDSGFPASRTMKNV